ncbi:MAG TPA: AMP-binding protein [Gemmatimonadales bacterium]|nr:AMP-binding protein [Gemmatimonadales bacterium]
MSGAPSPDVTGESPLERVLEVLRELALELGGPRALRAVSPTASLEREVGLGSLERVEFLLRLEAAFGRELPDRFLLLDTAREITQAIIESGTAAPLRAALPAAALPAASQAPTDIATVDEALWRRALADCDRPHVYLYEPERRVEEISYGRLWAEAASVAGGLSERGVERGETVALMLPTGMDFLRSFQGILVARAVPVPLYPPARLDRLEEYLARQAGILANAGARYLITIPEVMPVVHVLRQAVPSLEEVTTAGELSRLGRPASRPMGSASDAALIQYTSGSTGNPKGVLLTHANLLANIRAVIAGMDLRPTDVGVSWLPLYHDMGLIGAWLLCLYYGIPLALLSPLAFLTRPERWLWAIHERRATLSGAPNFAYELCVKKVSDKDIEGLDLSSWRCAFNGSEPVSPDTMDRFARRFERYGFRREAFVPVYGLAECTVGLCIPPLGRDPLVDRVAREAFESHGRAEPAAPGDRSPLRFPSVGSPLPGHEVRIVDESGEDVPDRVVGRLVFRGPSAMSGYFRNPEATAAITLPEGWLDSGDLAYKSGAELYITGRRKDLIIKGGRNLVAEEIEEVAGSVEGIRKGCVAAFGVADPALGTEALVVVAETRIIDPEELSRLEGAVIARVAADTGIPPDRVVLLAPGSVAKTPSGKLRRGRTKELYLAGRLGAKRRITLGRRLALLRGAALGPLRSWLARARRALYLTYLGIVSLVVLIPLLLVTWALVAALPSRRGTFTLGRFGSRLILRLVGCRLSVEGLEELRRRGPFILVANHASYVDSLALVALVPLDFVFVAKREVLSWPVVGTFVRKQRHPTVDRWDPKQSVADAQAVSRVIRGGTSVLYFPEGTFTAATGLRPFRLGAFEAAAATGTPVVPVALRGTRRVLRDGVWLPRPGPIGVWIGSALVPASTAWRDVLELRDRAADVIAAHCNEPRLDLVAGGPVRAWAKAAAPGS